MLVAAIVTFQRKAGIYRILQRPFYLQPIIGSGARIYVDRVERIADLPADKRANDFWYPCVMLCRNCATPYTIGAEAKEVKP